MLQKTLKNLATFKKVKKNNQEKRMQHRFYRACGWNYTVFASDDRVPDYLHKIRKQNEETNHESKNDRSQLCIIQSFAKKAFFFTFALNFFQIKQFI